jgi:hypothetical protein
LNTSSKTAVEAPGGSAEQGSNCTSQKPSSLSGANSFNNDPKVALITPAPIKDHVCFVYKLLILPIIIP